MKQFYFWGAVIPGAAIFHLLWIVLSMDWPLFPFQCFALAVQIMCVVLYIREIRKK